MQARTPPPPRSKPVALNGCVLRRRGAKPSDAATRLLALARARFTEPATTPRGRKR